MNKLVLEIGFVELLVVVLSSALMGVLLMVLYHRLAMRRERERQRQEADFSRQTTSPAGASQAQIVAPQIPGHSPFVINETESVGSLDFHSPKPGD